MYVVQPCGLAMKQIGFDMMQLCNHETWEVNDETHGFIHCSADSPKLDGNTNQRIARGPGINCDLVDLIQLSLLNW